MKFNNILGGNGLFILAVVALLLLCKDDKNLIARKTKVAVKGINSLVIKGRDHV